MKKRVCCILSFIVLFTFTFTPIYASNIPIIEISEGQEILFVTEDDAISIIRDFERQGISSRAGHSYWIQNVFYVNTVDNNPSYYDFPMYAYYQEICHRCNDGKTLASGTLTLLGLQKVEDRRYMLTYNGYVAC